MDKIFRFDLKTVITIVTFAAAVGGFYYTTQLRLDSLEAKIQTHSKQIQQLKKRSKPRAQKR